MLMASADETEKKTIEKNGLRKNGLRKTVREKEKNHEVTYSRGQYSFAEKCSEEADGDRRSAAETFRDGKWNSGSI